MEKIFREKEMIKNAIFSVLLGASFFIAGHTEAASLSLSPTTGTFSVDSTFDVSIFLNTENETINAVEVSLGFPPDKLQLVSPSAGQSIVEIWATQPTFNNQKGEIRLQGLIPKGLSTSNGLVTRLTFRVKEVGTGVVRFLDTSKVLLHDGKGTDVLRQRGDALFDLALPPPQGPLVVSETHSDQTLWYQNPHVILRWEGDEAVGGYSYIINRDPVDVPDDISEGAKNSVAYKNLEDGRHYFHIKALRAGAWGGITNFAVKIDTTPPAVFPIEIIPEPTTDRRQPVIQFGTTDVSSGIDHYELKTIPLSLKEETSSGGEEPGDLTEEDQPIFIEATSPYVLSRLLLGTYDVVVRAYDKAGNYREATQHLAIVSKVFRVVGTDGIEFGKWLIPWKWFWLGVGILFTNLFSFAFMSLRWHRRIEHMRAERKLPQPIKKKLEDLKRFRDRYGGGGKALLVILLLGLTLFSGTRVFAEEPELAPPLVTAVSRDISNEEIFYIGGKTAIPQATVTIYLQNTGTGETFSYTTLSDKTGEWFYRHTTFLLSGTYLLWTQSGVADEKSPPTPQIQMRVRPTAFQLGSSRISYETFYLGIIVVWSIVILGLLVYTAFHLYHGRKKHHAFVKEMREAEEAIRRGFALLKRDIEAEIAVLRKAKLSPALSREEKQREEELMKDLTEVEQHIGEEVLDVWETER